jgi:hypothetical protein
VTLNCVFRLDNSYSWYIVTLRSKRKRQCKTQYVFNDQKTNSNLFLHILRTAINTVIFVLEMIDECKLVTWVFKMHT